MSFPTGPELNFLPAGIELPKNWEACSPGLEAELLREIGMNPLHPLAGVKTVSVARSLENDDVLFSLEGHICKLALVHLTYNIETDPQWPQVEFFASWQAWSKESRK